MFDQDSGPKKKLGVTNDRSKLKMKSSHRSLSSLFGATPKKGKPAKRK